MSAPIWCKKIVDKSTDATENIYDKPRRGKQNLTRQKKTVQKMNLQYHLQNNKHSTMNNLKRVQLIKISMQNVQSLGLAESAIHPFGSKSISDTHDSLVTFNFCS